VSKLRSSLRQARLAAGLSQEALARAVGISRQAYAAAESGAAVPSTEIALRLARVLGTTVEALFALPEADRPVLEADLVGNEAVQEPQRVRLLRVGGRLLARPLAGAAALPGLPWADGIARPAPERPWRVWVELLGEQPPAEHAIVVLGCDPAMALLAAVLRSRGVEMVCFEAASRAALEGLARGEAHVAGCHLLDTETGQYNAPWISRLVPFGCTVVGFAVWEQGLMVAPGNPLQIRDVAALARPGVRLVNREPGAGARALLDLCLAQARIDPSTLDGYERLASGHLAVAEAVRAGLADVGVGVRAAALAKGLDFIPLGQERYDLVVPNHFLDLPGVTALLDALRRPDLRQQVESLGGYDIAPMGEPAPAA
jgi:putative molybdopterin biosynthesis protein